MGPRREMLRHFLAAIAYRTQKALRDAPSDFADFRAAPGIRTPHEIIQHMTGVLGYARTFILGGEWRPGMKEDFSGEIERFHEVLTDLSQLLGSDAQFRDTTPKRLLQGPLADAMSHAGQLAMLRRFFGSPVPPENFIMADIRTENTGPSQAVATSPDEVWLDAEGNPQA